MRGTGLWPEPLACVAREKGRKVILNAKKIPGDRSRCRECNMRGTGALPVPLACVARVKKTGSESCTRREGGQIPGDRSHLRELNFPT